ncbi:MAG: hypothetical protein LBB54_02400 [Cellulomonadaceae bacterium]|jgi:hypothetical protein|nr:hypothetical protein [Cellulomonadaceae bacterium]
MPQTTRLYVPATFDDLDAATVTAKGARWTLPAGRSAHAVTPDLRDALPDEDDESLEWQAFCEAADTSAALVTSRAGTTTPALRVVISLDVPDGVGQPSTSDTDALSAVTVTQGISDAQVAAVHVDEVEVAGDFADADLLWYAPEEIPSIPRV